MYYWFHWYESALAELFIAGHHLFLGWFCTLLMESGRIFGFVTGRTTAFTLVVFIHFPLPGSLWSVLCSWKLFSQAGRIQGQFWRPLTSKSPGFFQDILLPFPSPGPVSKVDRMRMCFTVVRTAGHESLLRNTYTKNRSDSPLVLPFRSIILIDHYVVG